MTTRKTLEASRISPAAAAERASAFADTIAEVERAIEANAVVIVGMAQNPFVKKARAALDDAGVPYTYLEYGSYFSDWKRRLAIKMWSGWPTFPQVFVRGVLIGGADLTRAALADGSLRARLDAKAGGDTA